MPTLFKFQQPSSNATLPTGESSGVHDLSPETAKRRLPMSILSTRVESPPVSNADSNFVKGRADPRPSSFSRHTGVYGINCASDKENTGKNENVLSYVYISSPLRKFSLSHFV